MSKQRPITVKIDVTKILKQHLFKGNKGTYLDLVLWPNKDGEGQFGDTHYVVQELSKQAREAGERGPIIGNAKVPKVEQETRQAPPTRQQTQRRPAQDEGPIADGMEEEDIPF